MSSVTNGLVHFLDVLPAQVRERLEKAEGSNGLIEVVLDYGRPAEARYLDRVDRMDDIMVSQHDIDFVTKSIGEFGLDNRAGIERTLHRISCIRNRLGKVIGLTCRVGRALEGTIDIIDDIVRSGQSILILGRPGVGKTTKLREVARVLADEVGKRVVIVDTSNEIAGDGDVPHPGIGGARRMQVRIPSEQHQVMIEAVENHMPEVIVIDEIGTQKTVLERKAPPTFDVVLELIDFDKLAVHHNVQKTVDLILRGVPPRAEIRVKGGDGKTEIVQKESSAELDEPGFNRRYPSLSRAPAETEPAPAANGQSSRGEHVPARPGLTRIYPYGIARTRLERAIREKRAMAYIVNDIANADAVMAIRSTVQTRPRKLRELAERTVPTVVVKSNTYGQIAAALDDILKNSSEAKDFESVAMDEVLQAIDTVMQTGKPFDLSPQPAPIRKMQHQMTEAKRLASESVGEEPHRRLRVLPTRLG
jgi:stage III sporulation protein SpoIIIAA